MKKIDNPLRIKVTGLCNRDCSFCHHEGGDKNIEEIVPDMDLAYSIKELCQELHINSIALTGGEPLKHSDLPGFARFLHSQAGMNRLYMTTNGTIRKEAAFWSELQSCGLQKVNISVPDVMAEYKKNQAGTASEDIFQNQLQNIKEINKLNINVDINVVVFSDKMYTRYVVDTLNTLKRQGLLFHIYLLPNLTAGKYEQSINVINEVIEDKKYTKQYVSMGTNISNATKCYQDSEGNRLFVKTTEKNHKTYLLSGHCDKCKYKNECLEGFYGLRLEKRNGIYYIRTCLLNNTPEALIPLSEFAQSNVYGLLLKKWGGPV